jgi:hypothetical protein
MGFVCIFSGYKNVGDGNWIIVHRFSKKIKLEVFEEKVHAQW